MWPKVHRQLRMRPPRRRVFLFEPVVSQSPRGRCAFAELWLFLALRWTIDGLLAIIRPHFTRIGPVALGYFWREWNVVPVNEPYLIRSRVIVQEEAQVAELVDALGSGPSGGNTVGVRVPSWAPTKTTRLGAFFCARREVPADFPEGTRKDCHAGQTWGECGVSLSKLLCSTPHEPEGLRAIRRASGA